LEEEVIERLLADPPLVWQILEPDDPNAVAAGDLEKSWQGIHYLLTGTAWEGDPPLNFLLAGGREVDIEIGLGPPASIRRPRPGSSPPRSPG
jgi:hypothetical protein